MPLWVPPRVGVGADLDQDGWDDQTGLPAWTSGVTDAASGVASAVGQRLWEIPQAFAQGPMTGLSNVISLPFEAPPAALRYGGGVAVGAMQAGAEALGVDTRGPVQERLRSVPVIGEPLAASMGFLAMEDKPRELPPIRNILDPQEATQRYSAVAPPLLATGIDIAAGGGGLGKVAQGAKLGSRVIGRTLGMEKFVAPATSPLPKGVAQAIQSFSETPTGRGLGAVAKVGFPGAGAIAGIRESDAPLLTLDTAVHAAAGALTGSLAGGAARVITKAARLGAMPLLPEIKPHYSTDLQEGLLSLRQIRTVDHYDGTGSQLLHPGGWWGALFSGVSRELKDNLAEAKAIESGGVARIESGVAQKEAADALAGLRADLAAKQTRLVTVNAEERTKFFEWDARRAQRAEARKLYKQAEKADPNDPNVPVLRNRYIRLLDESKVLHRDWFMLRDEGEKLGADIQRLRETDIPRHELAAMRAPGGIDDDYLPYKRASMLSGMNSKVYEYARTYSRQALAPSFHKATGQSWGIRPGTEADLFDQWLHFRSILERWTDGIPTLPARDLAQAQRMYNDFVDELRKSHKRRGDLPTRFENTLRKMTEQSNGIVKELYDEGFITLDDYNKIIGKQFYINYQNATKTIEDWNKGTVNFASRLFSTAEDVGYEHTVSDLVRVSLKQQLERDKALLILLEKKRIGDALSRLAAADPTGVGVYARHFTPATVRRAQYVQEAFAAQEATVKQAQTALAGAESQLRKILHDLTQATKYEAQWEAKYFAATPGTPTYWRAMQSLARWRGRVQVLNKDVPAIQAARDLAATKVEAERRWLGVLRTRRRGLNLAAKKSQQSSQHMLPRGQSIWPIPRGAGNDRWIEMLEVPNWLWETAAGMDRPQVNHVLNIMNKIGMGALWRSAVTTFSIPFVQANIPRDFFTALQNTKDPRGFLIHYLPAVADVMKATGLQVGQDILDRVATMPFQNVSQMAAHFAGKLETQLERTSTRELYRHGGVIGTRGEVIAHQLNQGAGYTGTLLDTPARMLQVLSTLSELPARVAVFKAAKARGATGLSAAHEARTVVTDFSRHGNALRVINMFTPLLNARVQGELTSWDAMARDPYGFVGRLTAATAIPFLMSYAWNRSQFSDLYDKVPAYVTNDNIVILYGSYFDSEKREELPLYIKIPLNDVAASVVLPLRRMLDDQYHERHGQERLVGEERQAQSLEQDYKTWMAGFVPSNPNPEELDPFGLMMSFMAMSPMVGVATQLWANYDRFRGEPILDETSPFVGAEYRYNPDTHLYAIAASELLNGLGVLPGYVAPPQVDFAIRGIFGSLGAAPMADMIDGGLEILGYAPPVATKPEDLGLPPGTPAPELYEKWLQIQRRNDPRSLIEKVFSRYLGRGGGAQAIISKAEAENPAAAERWRHTLGLQNDLRSWQMTQFEQDREETFASERAYEEWSHKKILSRNFDLLAQNTSVRRTLQSKWDKAITDPNERKKFIESLPGPPIGSEYSLATMALPPGTDIKALTQRYLNPPGVDMLSLNKLDQEKARGRELRAMATELSQSGTPVSPEILKLAISAEQSGFTLPALPVPAIYLDDWVSRYRMPMGLDPKTLEPDELRVYRNLELDNIVKQFKLAEFWQESGRIDSEDPNADATARDILLTQVIRPRLSPIGPVYELELQADRALAVADRLANTQRFPKYAKADGTAVGTAAEWRKWDDEWRLAKSSGKDWEDWTPRQKLIDVYRRYGEILRLNARFNDPDAEAYERFFGWGADLTPKNFEQWQTGVLGKYLNPKTGKFVDPQTARKWDYVMELYEKLPETDPTKKKLRPYAWAIRKLMVPGWQELFGLAILQPASVRAREQRVLEAETELFEDDDEEV